MRPFSIAVQLIGLLLLFSCDDEEVNRPVFHTQAVDELTAEGVTYNASITVLGNAPIINYGFVWAPHNSPGVTDSVYYFDQAPETGEFTKRVQDDLIPNAEYFVRSFVKTSKSVYYSNTVRFKSLGSAAPVIKDFNPKTGSSLQSVTITGDHFSKITFHQVTIGTTLCQVVSSSRTSLVIQIPEYYVAGNYPITVTVGGKSVNSTSQFTLEGPVVQSIAPTSGPAGTVLTITGSGFLSSLTDNKVTIGDLYTTVTNATANELVVVVPYSEVAGEKDVLVSAQNATGISPVKFNLTGPTITSFSPSSGLQGSEVVISGTGFSSTPEENTVVIGNGYHYAEVIAATPEQLTVRVPHVTAAGQVGVWVTVKSITTSAVDLFTIEGPEITSFSPSAQYGGRTITLYGKNFDAGGLNDVYFPDHGAGIMEHSTNSLTVQVPFALVRSGPITVRVGGISYTTPQEFSLLSPWQKQPAFPGGKRYGAVSFTVGSYAYVAMGIGPNGDLRDVWRFDPSNNSWTRKADYPGPSRAYSFSFVVNGKAYVGGGGHYGSSSYDLKNKHYDLWEYNPATDTWTQKQSFSPNGLSDVHIAATGIGSYGYFTANNLLYQYDPSINQWSISNNSYPWTHTAGSIAITIGNKGYFGLGLYNTTWWEFTPATNTWKQLADSPIQLWALGPVSFVINNKLYIGTNTTFWVFDPLTDEWKQLPGLPEEFINTASFSVNNTGYFATGLNGVAFDFFYSFDPNY